MRSPIALVVAMSFGAFPSAALAQTIVRITVVGSVDYEQASGPPLDAVQPGDHATMSFEVDVNSFVDHPGGRVRGFPIAPSSFVLTLGSVAMGLEFPWAQTPYFVLRNDDPAVDGFRISTALTLAEGVPLDVDGNSGAIRDDFSVTFAGTTLSTIDIVDAAGDYQLPAVIDSHWAIDDGPASPVGLSFTSMLIELLAFDPLVRRGDCNGDGLDDIADAITLLTGLFNAGGGSPYIACKDSCDANDDGQLDIADAVALLSSLFGAPTIPLPPPTGACGLDPTPDIVPCSGQPAC
jgi:hypothetical protein